MTRTTTGGYGCDNAIEAVDRASRKATLDPFNTLALENADHYACWVTDSTVNGGGKNRLFGLG